MKLHYCVIIILLANLFALPLIGYYRTSFTIQNGSIAANEFSLVQFNCMN